MYKVEIIATNLASGANAYAGGADRIELVENLYEGGCTPSLGLMRQFKKLYPSMPVYAMIRPRGGDFVYTAAEIEQMYSDIDVCKSLGIDGIVFGVLNKQSAINSPVCKELLQFWGKPQATFHRAIDRCSDMSKSLRRVVDLGFERVLTSGGKSTALQGIDTIKELQATFGQHITVMPGSGVTSANAGLIKNYCNIFEIHASCKIQSVSVVEDNGFGDVYQLAGRNEVHDLCQAFKYSVQ